MQRLRQEQVQRVQGNEDEGVGWGMDFDEEEIRAYQKRMEEEEEQSE